MDTTRLPPLPPPPRQVKLVSALRDPVHFSIGIVGLTFLLVGLIQGVVFTWLARPWVDLSLDRSHLEATGTLLQTEVVTSEHYGDRYPTLFTFRFEIDKESGPATVTGRSKSLAPALVVVGPDRTVTVQYDPVRPTWSRIAGTRCFLFPLWALAFPYLMLPAGIVLLMLGLRRRARLRRILELGDEISGTVLEVKRLRFKRHKRSGNHAHRVMFEYYPAGGRRQLGTAETYDPAAAAHSQPGSPIRLLVLAELPEHAVAPDLLTGTELLTGPTLPPGIAT
jgi:hypothetical protein